jgi:hypothetical protein
VHSLQCTCTVHSVRVQCACTVYSVHVQCTVYVYSVRAQFTVYSAQCACTVYSIRVQCTVYVHSVRGQCTWTLYTTTYIWGNMLELFIHFPIRTGSNGSGKPCGRNLQPRKHTHTRTLQPHPGAASALLVCGDVPPTKLA